MVVIFFSATQCQGCVRLSEEKRVLESEKQELASSKAQLEKEILSLKQQLHGHKQSEVIPHAAAKTGLFTEEQVRKVIKN